MSYDTDTLNRQKIALKQLEVVLNEITYQYNNDSMYKSIIDSLVIFSRPLDDITYELYQFNNNR